MDTPNDAGFGESETIGNDIDSEQGSAPDPDTIIDEDDPAYTEPQSTVAQAQKAIEAAEASSSTGSSSLAPSSRRPSFTASSRRPSFASSHRPPSSIWSYLPQRFYTRTGAPPPGYEEAIASQSAFQQQRPLPSDVQDDAASLYTSPDSKKRHGISVVGRHWKKLCLINLAIYCIVATTLLLSYRLAGSEVVEIAWSSPSWARAEKYHVNTPECHFDTSAGFKYFSWNESDSFSLTESLGLLRHEGRISGRVSILPAPFHQEDQVYVISSVATTSAWIAQSPTFEQDTYGMRIALSSNIQQSSTNHHDLRSEESAAAKCLDVWVGIYVKEPPEYLEVLAQNLEIEVGLPGVSFTSMSCLRSSEVDSTRTLAEFPQWVACRKT